MNEELIPQLSLHRAIIVKDMRVGENECTFSLSNIHASRQVDGIFYTDPTGRKIVSGPGPNSVRQFIKPGFQAIIGEGQYEPVDTWIGMYKLKHTGSFQNVGYGVDPTTN